jgi:hypothetical protein
MLTFDYAREPGPGLVHLQLEPHHQCFHPCLRPLGIAGSAADHQIIRIVDDVGVELILVPVVAPSQQKRGKQRCASIGLITEPCGVLLLVFRAVAVRPTRSMTGTVNQPMMTWRTRPSAMRRISIASADHAESW